MCWTNIKLNTQGEFSNLLFPKQKTFLKIEGESVDNLAL